MKRKIDLNKLILEVFLIITAATAMIPVYYLFVSTFKSSNETLLHPLALPKAFTLEYYKSAWEQMDYLRVLGNTAYVAILALIFIIFLGSMAAYGISRCESKLTKIIFMFFLMGMMIPAQLNALPLFNLMKSLKLMDSLTGLSILYIFYSMPFTIFLYTGFISTVPRDLEEAARIDGANIFQVFFRIVLPLLKPVTATVATLQTLYIWNDFTYPLLFIQSRTKHTIIKEVYNNVGQFTVDWAAMFPMLVLGVIPLLIFYTFMQKYIVKGITSGAVKG
ncbi:MAG: hypothetical protein APF77_17565 [Clostridia bacterium BRH_c25]|nr:MAG: hypothetical protein APF77_17565 [Clostridia bacterium BRH_c25]